MKQSCRITASVVVLGVVLANTGVLHAVHLLPWSQYRYASDSSRLCWMRQSGAGHDAGTCALCIQLAAAKKVLADFATPISLFADIETEAAFVAVQPLQSVRPSSPLARAPPSICL